MKMIKDYLFYTSTNDFPIITTGEFFILHRRQTAAAEFKMPLSSSYRKERFLSTRFLLRELVIQINYDRCRYEENRLEEFKLL